MATSKECKLMCGIILLAVPSIMYGGYALLGILTSGQAGAASGLQLDQTQWSLWRASHAHAGVIVILSLVMQLLLDSAALGSALRWTSRILAPLASIFVSGGFFGLAFIPAFKWLLYLGAAMLLVALVLTGVGLLVSMKREPARG